ncbi:MAG TPA: MarR family transcriptional regulator [Roseiflexaceae bacterium]|mgnify:CR=1 FL=1|nr:MarR family transcriptional regulator [Roseiflexaceae bacterium]HMP40784.1 MarR family transcriptional regulator [Roseiflexaceae bacterium]
MTHDQSQLRQPAVLSWLRLARIYQKIDAISARHFREHGLSTAQFDVLAQIGANEGISQQQLARTLLVTKGNISQILGRMEQDGLIRRTHAGRANCLYLTDTGRNLYHAAVPAQEVRIAALFDSLSRAEQQQLQRLLRILDRSISE